MHGLHTHPHASQKCPPDSCCTARLPHSKWRTGGSVLELAGTPVTFGFHFLQVSQSLQTPIDTVCRLYSYFPQLDLQSETGLS